MKLHHQFTSPETIYCHPNNTLSEYEIKTQKEGDQDDGTKSEHVNIIIGKDNDSSRDENSSSTFSSTYKEDSDVEDQVPKTLATNVRLSRLINVLDDDCIATNVGYSGKHDSVEEHFKVDKSIKPRQVIFNENGKDEVPRMDWNNYHRLNVIHSFMDDLEYDYPSICTTGTIGKSLEGRDLKILKISNSDTSNSSVWIDAGIHAREWIAPAVATYVANHIARNFTYLPASVTSKDWYFLPVVNPDGYEYSHTVDRMWRKNRAYHAGECVGVDLNRNFSCGWGGKGSSSVPTNVFYRGPEPFSEPESSAIRDMLMSTGISFKVYITLHSFGQVIIFPYAHKEELCPDYVRLLEGATAMSKGIYDCTGNTYKVGISRDVLYGAAGTSNDFSYGTVGIPFCYLIELRNKRHKFKLPKEDIEDTGREIVCGIQALMEFVDQQSNVKQQQTVADWENDE